MLRKTVTRVVVSEVTKNRRTSGRYEEPEYKRRE